VIGGPCILGVCLTIYKLVKFSQTRGTFSKGIPEICLILMLISNALRAVEMIGDPLSLRRIYPYRLSTILWTLPYPFIIISSLLMSMYWMEAMSKSSLEILNFLAKLRIPFYTLSAVIGAMEIVSDVIRVAAFEASRIANIVSGVFYLFIVTALSIFYMITCVKLLKKMKESQALQSRTKFLRKITYLILASAIMLFISDITIAVRIPPQIGGDINGWTAVNFTMILPSVAGTICQIMVFNPKSSKSSKSTSKRSRNTPDQVTTQEM